MVTGLQVFRQHFAGFEQAYVLIGGAACDQWFSLEGGRFRATRDLDIVLILKAVDSRFFPRFREFLRNGGYKTGQRAEDGKKTFYRFLKPSAPDYPYMIELFSAIPLEDNILSDQHIIPIPAGEDQSSLSAILMNQEYFDFIMEQRDVVDGLSLIKPAGLISLKARAWHDLSRRRRNGDLTVIERDINKHRNDSFRLATLLPAGVTISVHPEITADLHEFLEAILASPAEQLAIRQALAANGIRIAPTELASILKTFYGINP